jgi:hypothetical protein
VADKPSEQGVCFSDQAHSGQAPSGQALIMHSVVVWLRAHPEPG